MYGEPRSRWRSLLPITVISILAVAALAIALVLLRQELVDARYMAIVTQGQLAQVQTDWQADHSRLADIEAEMEATQSELASTGAALETAREQTSRLEATLDNLEVNYDRLTRGYDYVLNDPTYEMVMEFLADDGTNDKKYDETEYNCTDYSADVKANAADEGIRCAYVNIYFAGHMGHSIVAFDTTDEGLVFIEPQTDDEVDLQVGQRYHESVLAKPGEHYLAPDDDDTVVRFTVIW
jgi:hypothetical protein